MDVLDIGGIGKREAGTVDEVICMVAKTTHDVTTLLMKLVDDQGCEFDPSSEGSMELSATGDQSAEPFSAQLQPGVTKRFTLAYDAPTDASGLKLHIPAGFGVGKSANIKVPSAGE